MLARIVACGAALLLFGAAPAPRSPLWTRGLPAGPPVADPQPLVVRDAVVVRSGYGLVVLDAASGKTRWSLPSATDVAVSDDAVVVARADSVEGLRPADGGVVWRRECRPPTFVLRLADRIATVCSRRLTILRAHDGSVVAERPLPRPVRPPYRAAALTDRYFTISNDLRSDSPFAVVDARTGVLCWRSVDTLVVDAGLRWVELTPVNAPGTLIRRDLATGKVLARNVYRFSVPVEDHGTPLYATSSAVYALAGQGELYRSPRDGSEMTRVTPERGVVITPTILDGSAFYGTQPTGTATTAIVHVDRYEDGAFKDADLGAFDPVPALRAGDRVALNAHGTIAMFDARGGEVAALHTSCATLGAVAVAARRWILLCPTKTASSILAFPRS